MPYQTQEHLDIPYTSVASFLFTSPTHELSREPLFIDADRPARYLSFDTYRLWAQRLAAGLRRKRGFRRGDRLLIYSTNSIFYVVAYMGTIMAGGIFTGSSPGYTARELTYHVKDADPAVVLLFPDGYERGLKAAEEAGVSRDRIYVFDGETEPPAKPYGSAHWSELLASEEEGRRFEWSPCDTREGANETIALNYSSGTTGLPKGVMMTHRNFVANLMQFENELKHRPDPVLASTTHLCFLPMNHAMAQLTLAMGCPAWGGKVYVQKAFNFQEVLQAVANFKVDNLMLVPPVIVAMAKSPALKAGKIDLSSVRTVGTGAAPISGETIREFGELFAKRNAHLNGGKGTLVRNGYGMSEATCGITGGVRDADPAYIQSVGPPMAMVEVKLMVEVDGAAREVTGRGGPEDGERGELWVRGPNVMKGYWRKPEATASTVTPDGWLRTGDVVTMDTAGRIYIVDRIKELIKVKGNQVAPAELEALLLEHPAVADAAVIGVPTEDGKDEVPRAYVKLKDEEEEKRKKNGAAAAAFENDIQAFVADRVNKNKRLLGGVRFAPDGIPKNPSGKILRKVLREQAARERGAKL